MEHAIHDPAAPSSSRAAPHGRLLLLAPGDNVAVATVAFPAGALAALDGGEVALIDAVPMGHKVAVAPIAAAEKIVKYGCPIGSALRAIQPGEHVHTHNIKSDYLPTRTR
jgi:altronate dehydratase small subunit